MAQVNIKRAVIERLAQKAREDANLKGKSIQTIDPVLKTAKKMYPYYSEKELQEYASTALRYILSRNQPDLYQTKLFMRL